MKKSPLKQTLGTNTARGGSAYGGHAFHEPKNYSKEQKEKMKKQLKEDFKKAFTYAVDLNGNGKVDNVWEAGLGLGSWFVGGGAVKGAIKGGKWLKGALKSPFNHCDSEMMHSGGWGEVRKYNSPGTTGNKEGIKHNEKMREEIGTFKMPHESPFNKGHEVNKDSIAAAKAWKAHKAEYLKKEGGQEEYDREKGEFFYSPKHKKLRLIPTDDGEVQDRSGIEKWQLAPDRKSSALHQNDMLGNRFEREQDEPGETQFFNKRKTIKPLSTGGGGDEYFVPEPRGTYRDTDGTVKFEDGTDAGYPEERVYNMTPNATPEESRAVRNKFDATYLKGRGPFQKKKEGKKDACYHKVKSRVKVWPSAYASGQLVQCRKAGAANWGEKSKDK